MWLLTTLLLLGSPAHAQERKVLLFGGTYSREGEMKAWQSRAMKACGETHAFEAVASPAADDQDIGDILGGRKKGSPYKAKLDAAVKKYVEEIIAHPQREYVIAGHSSAGSLAKVLAHKVMLCQKQLPGCPAGHLPPTYTTKYKDKIKLRLLDGGQTGYPDFMEVKDYFATECWAAKGGYFHDRLKQSCGDKFREIKGVSCQSKKCWHYSAINGTPPKNLQNWKGYDGDKKDQWKPNLDWVGDGCSSQGTPGNGPRAKPEEARP